MKMPQSASEAIVYIAVFGLGLFASMIKQKPDQAILGILGTLALAGMAILGLVKLADLGVDVSVLLK